MTFETEEREIYELRKLRMQIEDELRKLDEVRPRPTMLDWARNPDKARAQLEQLRTEHEPEGRRRVLSADLSALESKLKELELELKRAKAHQECLQESGMGITLIKAIDDLRTTEAIDTVREWRDGNEWSLLMLGGVGVGKSVAAAFWFNERAYWRGAPKWVNASRACMLSVYGEEATKRLEGWFTAKALVLDDLGAEPMNPSWAGVVYQLIEARSSNQLATLVTSNLDKQAFKARYGERVSDRLRMGKVATFGGASLRVVANG